MSKLQKNFIYNIMYQMLLIALPLVTAPYVSRVLGVSGVGTYSYIYSIAYYFCLFGMLGISNHGNRSIALKKNDSDSLSKTFSSIYIIQFITTGIALIIYYIYIKYFFSGNKVIAYIDILYLVSYMLDINWFFWGLEEFKLTVTRNMIFKILTAVLTFVLVKNPQDLWKYTLILAMGTLLSQMYLWGYLRRYIKRVKLNFKDIVQHIKPIFVLFIPVISYSIYKVMDKIMLGSITDVIQVGLYENAEKIVGIPTGIITAFGTVMMPRISTLTAQDKSNEIENYNKLSFKYFSLISFGMVFGLVGVSKVLPGVYFGKEFIKCGSLIAGLSFTLIFMTWANIIRTQYLIPNQKDKPYVISTVIGAVINLIINFILIPRFQAKGALVGTLCAEFSVFIVQAFCVRKDFKVFKFLKSSIGFFASGLIMGGSVYYIGDRLGASVKTLLIQVCVGVVLYILLSSIYLVCTKDEFLCGMLKKMNVFNK